MLTLAVACAMVVAYGAFAAETAKAEKAKPVAEMTVTELEKALKDKEADLAKATDAAKKAEVQKSIDEIKAALDSKKAVK